MKEVYTVLEELKGINTAYGIDTDGISRLQAEMSEAKVCTPIIGKFSSGKSALVNTILGYSRKILREDITPETAIPAEIVYSESEDSISIIKMMVHINNWMLMNIEHLKPMQILLKVRE